jgi:hypothetical protein
MPHTVWVCSRASAVAQDDGVTVTAGFEAVLFQHGEHVCLARSGELCA